MLIKPLLSLKYRIHRPDGFELQNDTEQIIKPVVQQYGNDGQKLPESEIRNTYLTHEIEILVAVVPYVPAKRNVENQAERELYHGDRDSGQKHLRGKAHVPFEHMLTLPEPSITVPANAPFFTILQLETAAFAATSIDKVNVMPLYNNGNSMS